MRHFAIAAAAAALFTIGGMGAAAADECSGHSHDTGTAVGAIGGAAIGGLASHSIVGAVVGGVVGGVAGNAIARDKDCNEAVNEDRARQQAYNDGYSDRAADEAHAATSDPRPLYPNDADRRDPVAVYPEPGDPQ